MRQAAEWLRVEARHTLSERDVSLNRAAEADSENGGAATLWTGVTRDAWQHATDRGYLSQPNARAYYCAGSSSDS